MNSNPAIKDTNFNYEYDENNKTPLGKRIVKAI